MSLENNLYLTGNKPPSFTMENLVFLLATTLAYSFSASKKFRRYPIGETPHSVLLPRRFDGFDHCTTQHGDRFYLGESSAGLVNYGVIYIGFKEEFESTDAETLLRGYISKLHTPFSIAYNTGIHHCESHDEAGLRVITDFWQDEWGVDWKIKGYTDGSFLAVLYVQNINDADVNVEESFFSGLS
jgi:hypothetical protein